MKIISVIECPDVLRGILQHLGFWGKMGSPPKSTTLIVLIISCLPAKIIFTLIQNTLSKHTHHDKKMPEDLMYSYVRLRPKWS
jgi:hypothetical protein